jgi:hypothetical protein
MGKYWFHFRKIKQFFFCKFRHDLSKKKFRLSRAVAAGSPLRARELKFWTKLQFGPSSC